MLCLLLKLLQKPAVLKLVDQKPSFTPFGHLKKYKKNLSGNGGDEADQSSNRKLEPSATMTRFVGVSDVSCGTPKPDNWVSLYSTDLTEKSQSSNKGKRSLGNESNVSESFVRLPASEVDGSLQAKSPDRFISSNIGSNHSKRRKKAQR